MFNQVVDPDNLTLHRYTLNFFSNDFTKSLGWATESGLGVANIKNQIVGEHLESSYGLRGIHWIDNKTFIENNDAGKIMIKAVDGSVMNDSLTGLVSLISPMIEIDGYLWMSFQDKGLVRLDLQNYSCQTFFTEIETSKFVFDGNDSFIYVFNCFNEVTLPKNKVDIQWFGYFYRF